MYCINLIKVISWKILNCLLVKSAEILINDFYWKRIIERKFIFYVNKKMPKLYTLYGCMKTNVNNKILLMRQKEKTRYVKINFFVLLNIWNVSLWIRKVTWRMGESVGPCTEDFVGSVDGGHRWCQWHLQLPWVLQIGPFKQSRWRHDAAVLFFCFSSKVHDWLLLNFFYIFFFWWWWWWIMSQMWCSEPLHREWLFYFKIFFHSIHIWLTGFDVKWIRKRFNLKQSVTEWYSEEIIC